VIKKGPVCGKRRENEEPLPFCNKLFENAKPLECGGADAALD
jgi:hypothetical protein